MQNTIDIGWLDVGTREDSRLAVVDYRRLPRIVAELPDPETQYPSLCVFLGGKSKDHALQQIYTLNNIKRHASEAQVRLRYDIASSESSQPVLLVDGAILCAAVCHSLTNIAAGVGIPQLWEIQSAEKLLQILWSRIIFLFADVVCIFIDDITSLDRATEFLIICMELGSASSESRSLLPRLILIYDSELRVSDVYLYDDDPVHNCLWHTGYNDLSAVFSGKSCIYVPSTHLSDRARYLRIKTAIAEQVIAISFLRQVNRGRPNSKHFLVLFQSAVVYTLSDLSFLFDIIKTTRKDCPVSLCAESNLVHYLEIGHRASLCLCDLVLSIVSALFMDHYVPRMLDLSALLRSQVLWPDLCPTQQTDTVEYHFFELFEVFTETKKISAIMRRTQIESQSGKLCRLRTNLICLFCLLNAAQYILACGHAMCDRCAQVFGDPVAGTEYQFNFRGCLCCLYQRPLTVDVLLPTMSLSVLALDGGGVRGVIPLEFLLLVQEHLCLCTIQEVIDLALGTSSGGLIALGLFSMFWGIRECSERFKTLARCIFSQRRPSILSLLLYPISGYKSLFGEADKWIQWLLYDSCYDSRIFDAAFKDIFGENRRLFGATGENAPSPQQSGTKVGVVTTSISKSTSIFVIGNFNASHYATSEVGRLPGIRGFFLSLIMPLDYHILYLNNIQHEPCLWRVFFTPVDLEEIGSFQDGGLKKNFAGKLRARFPIKFGLCLWGLYECCLWALERHCQATVPRIFVTSFKMDFYVEDDIKGDCHRLNVSLGEAPQTIDAVEVMDEYSNLVLLQSGSALIAREAAIILLVSRFFFFVGLLPEYMAVPFWCSGLVRCRGPARKIVAVLEYLYPEGLSYISDSGLIDNFGGLDNLCPSYRCYNRPISFLTCHLDHTVNIYIQNRSKKQWRISGFPETVATFALRQGLHTPFGRGDHNYPNRHPCHECDVIRDTTKNKRRRRQSTESGNISSKKRAPA
ncbi:hypothetical protein N7450_001775 [Penicillium hetheringtonii]|uniref:PNPLA domain-containing protein n=1 Tax=Penicillium hetheringtonii TaxID=911720 RepID=A0AAD6H2P5_9EURO|nr:hypothetical protein N7450_001775 [Penicillium hetheringtonii]